MAETFPSASESRTGEHANVEHQPAWVSPRLTVIDVHETRNGIDPIFSDGEFSFGS